MSAIEAMDAAENDHFVVHLTRSGGTDVKVTSVELLYSDIRNRYSFKQERPLDEVFAEKLADAFRKALAKMSKTDRIVVLPDFEVSLPGLVIGGLRILSATAEKGSEVIMIRVREYVGAIKSAFKFDPALPAESASVRERIAVEVLRDIVNPLLDILSIAKDAPNEVLDNNSEAVRRQLRRMSTRQQELHFFTGLLKRYISGCRSDAGQTQIPAENEIKIETRLFNGN